MPTARLSTSFVRNASCSPNRRKVDYFDTKLPGFLLEVRQTGGKTYYQRYRTVYGDERQVKIGSASVLSISQARLQAKRIAAAAALGEDPRETRLLKRTIPTYAKFINATYLPYAKAHKRSWRTDETILR